MKQLKFAGTSLDDLKKFPDRVKQLVGYQLHKVQNGQSPTDWKPMNTIGQGVMEIRIHLNNEYRVFYVATFPESIYVLHAFQKKTQKTKKQDLDIAARRYKEIAN